MIEAGEGLGAGDHPGDGDGQQGEQGDDVVPPAPVDEQGEGRRQDAEDDQLGRHPDPPDRLKPCGPRR